MMRIKGSFYETLSPLFEKYKDMAIFFLDLQVSNFFHEHLDLHVSFFFTMLLSLYFPVYLYIREFFRCYRRAFMTGIGYLREEVPRLLSSYGLTALELPGPADVEIMQFFRWLCSCLSMVESGSHLHWDLCAMVAACALAA
jgi:hypothetical protein